MRLSGRLNDFETLGYLAICEPLRKESKDFKLTRCQVELRQHINAGWTISSQPLGSIHLTSDSAPKQSHHEVWCRSLVQERQDTRIETGTNEQMIVRSRDHDQP